jgi:hypothetical protein
MSFIEGLPRPFGRIVIALLAVPVVLVAVNLVALVLRRIGLAGPVPVPLNIGHEASLLSWYVYGLWAILVVALLIAWRRHGRPVLLALAAIAALLTVDDVLELHEQLGDVLAPWFPPRAGLESDDLGELAAWAGYALVVLPVLVIAILRDDRGGRAWGLLFAGLFALLAVFGIAFDMLHAAVGSLSLGPLAAPARWFFGLAEDGGEAATIAVMCACGLVAARPGTLPKPRLPWAVMPAFLSPRRA